MMGASGLGRRAVTGLLLSAVLFPGLPAVAEQGAPTGPRLAIRGYDPVAYFTDGRAVKGEEAYEFEWLGSHWRFASAEHRAMFAADPERYAPQFGAYCAPSMAAGEKSPSDPEAWAIVDGKLYLGSSKRSIERWRQNVAENIRLGEQHWAALRPN